MWIRCWLGLCVIALTIGCMRVEDGPESEKTLRVLSLSPSNTELLFAIGADDLLVGRTMHCDYPAKSAEIPSVGSLFPPDFERLLSVRPNLVIMSDGHLKIRERFERLKIPVVVVHPKTVDDIAHSMRQLGQALGRETQANEAAALFEERLKKLSKKGRSNTKVLYEVAPKPMRIPGQSTFLADLMRHAGGRPVGSDGQGDWPVVNKEWVLHTDPQVFLVADAQRKAALKDASNPLRTVSAVQKDAVYVVPDPDLFVRPGPRVLEAITWLGNALDDQSR